MFEENNLLLFAFSVIPALVYSFLIYIKIPQGNLKLRASIGYLIFGILAPMLVLSVAFIFPNWSTYIEYDINRVIFDPSNGRLVIFPTTFAYFFSAFVQIALLEESSKLVSGSFLNIVRGSWVKRDSPIAVMFYYCMIATGFAIAENVVYAQRAEYYHLMNPDINPSDIIFSRSASAILLHMISGLFMGYFIAIGRQFAGLKKLSYTMLGLLVAVFIHGAYDFNLIKPTEGTFFSLGNYNVSLHIANTEMILLSMLLAFLMGNHLLKIKYKEMPKLPSNN